MHTPNSGVSRPVVSLQPALSSRAEIFIRQTTDRLPSRKSPSILKILIQKATTTKVWNTPQYPARFDKSSPKNVDYRIRVRIVVGFATEKLCAGAMTSLAHYFT